AAEIDPGRIDGRLPFQLVSGVAGLPAFLLGPGPRPGTGRALALDRERRRDGRGVRPELRAGLAPPDRGLLRRVHSQHPAALARVLRVLRPSQTRDLRVRQPLVVHRGPLGVLGRLPDGGLPRGGELGAGRLYGSGQSRRPDALAARPADHAPRHFPHHPAVAQQHVHLAVQRHGPGLRARRAGANLRRRVAERQHLPNDRGVDIRHGDVPVRGVRHRVHPAPRRAPLRGHPLRSGMLHDLSFALPQLLRGLAVTLEIGAIVVIAGSLAGFVVGLSLLYGGLVVRLAARVYVDTVRGLPVLVLIFAIYFALPAFGLRFSAFQAGVTALSIFAAAHIAEIVRGGIDSIPGAQVDAAKAVGLTFWQRLRLVILPQAVRRMVPSWVNVAVEIVKGSAL